MPTTEFLLHTKLHFPPVRSKLIARPRLVALLDEGLTHPLTLISAPAGFGKTTLLAEWRHDRPGQKLPAAWLSLDSDNNQIAQFLTYFSAAIGGIAAGLGESALALLQSPQPPSVNSVLTMLINDLSALQHPSALILDDYQVIDAESVHQAVMFLLDHLPEQMHLVIATRSDPPLPLARLRARGQLVEIRADDLRFTADEAAAFLEQVMNLSLSPTDISTLETRTEGWIAGLQMAALSMQGRSDTSQFIQEFSGSHRYILDYLAEEVLNRQPEDVQHFLMVTSVLERFCAALCAEMVTENEAWVQETLEYLDRANLFLVALDDERCWYRYHHLFADLLKARLRQAQPHMVSELHLRASQWFENNGLIPEAVAHAFSAHDDERAAMLIERHGATHQSMGDPILLMMAGRLPAEVLRSRPRLSIYRAWMQIGEGRSRDAVLMLTDLKQGISASASPSDAVWMQEVANLFIAYLSEPTTAEPPTSLPDYSAIEQIPEQDLGLRNTADVLYTLILTRNGELDAAADILDSSMKRDLAAQGSAAILQALPFLIRIRLMQGRLHEAANLCQENLQSTDGNGKHSFYTAGILNIFLGEILYEWNDLEGAEQQIREGLRANERWNNFVIDTTGYLDLVKILAARGDHQEALATMQKLEGLRQGRTGVPDIDEEIQMIKVRMWLASGDLDKAGEWADQMALVGPSEFLQGWGYVTLARVRLAQGRQAEAQVILETVARLPDADTRLYRQLRVDLYMALALIGQGRRDEALGALEACLSQAEPGGYCRLFLDSGEAVRDLLSAYLKTSAPRHQSYVQRLLDAFSSTDSGSDSPGWAESLTPRELDVLRLMAEGLSNRDIAGRLILSEGTVKFYVHAVLEKLQVHNRTQALIQAKERNLIP